MSKIVYICGPITGTPQGNNKTFERTATWYRNRGFLVINPHEVADSFANDIPEYKIMRSELAEIAVHVDFIALLPEWEKSRGALVEIATGIISGIPFVKAFSFEKVYPKLIIKSYGCETSQELVAKDNPAEEIFAEIGQFQKKQNARNNNSRTLRATAISV
jgi:hypothetical protein